MLLKHNANLGVKTKEGRTALLEASGCGGWEIVRCLIAHGADINTTANIVIESLFPIPRRRLNQQANIEQETDLFPAVERQETVLLSAVECQKWPMVEWLLQHPDLDVRPEGVHALAIQKIEASDKESLKTLLKERQNNNTDSLPSSSADCERKDKPF
jgi:ankyrin repeat protein